MSEHQRQARACGNGARGRCGWRNARSAQRPWRSRRPSPPVRRRIGHLRSGCGAWAADALLPNVIAFTPGTFALWDPWFDIQNGKGIIEDIASNIIKMIVNQDFSSGLEPGPVLDYFPYLSPPPTS